MKKAIVIPAFNEGGRIGDVVKGLKGTGLGIVVIDDGSTDDTFHQAKKQKVEVLRHRVNLGKGAALNTGCEAAFNLGYEAVIILDSDGQHSLQDLPKFIQALESNKYDVIFGSRNLNMSIPLVRFLGNKFASVLVSVLFGIYISDLVCGFRAFTKRAYSKFKWESRGYGVETEMVIRTGKKRLRYCEVPVQAIYYDKFKGVNVLDAMGILVDVFRWKINL